MRVGLTCHVDATSTLMVLVMAKANLSYESKL